MSIFDNPYLRYRRDVEIANRETNRWDPKGEIQQSFDQALIRANQVDAARDLDERTTSVQYYKYLQDQLARQRLMGGQNQHWEKPQSEGHTAQATGEEPAFKSASQARPESDALQRYRQNAAGYRSGTQGDATQGDATQGDATQVQARYQADTGQEPQNHAGQSSQSGNARNRSAARLPQQEQPPNLAPRDLRRPQEQQNLALRNTPQPQQQEQTNHPESRNVPLAKNRNLPNNATVDNPSGSAALLKQNPPASPAATARRSILPDSGSGDDADVGTQAAGTNRQAGAQTAGQTAHGTTRQKSSYENTVNIRGYEKPAGNRAGSAAMASTQAGTGGTREGSDIEPFGTQRTREFVSGKQSRALPGSDRPGSDLPRTQLTGNHFPDSEVPTAQQAPDDLRGRSLQDSDFQGSELMGGDRHRKSAFSSGPPGRGGVADLNLSSTQPAGVATDSNTDLTTQRNYYGGLSDPGSDGFQRGDADSETTGSAEIDTRTGAVFLDNEGVVDTPVMAKALPDAQGTDAAAQAGIQARSAPVDLKRSHRGRIDLQKKLAPATGQRSDNSTDRERFAGEHLNFGQGYTEERIEVPAGTEGADTDEDRYDRIVDLIDGVIDGEIDADRIEAEYTGIDVSQRFDVAGAQAGGTPPFVAGAWPPFAQANDTGRTASDTTRAVDAVAGARAGGANSAGIGSDAVATEQTQARDRQALGSAGAATEKLTSRSAAARNTAAGEARTAGGKPAQGLENEGETRISLRGTPDTITHADAALTPAAGGASEANPESMDQRLPDAEAPMTNSSELRNEHLTALHETTPLAQQVSEQSTSASRATWHSIDELSQLMSNWERLSGTDRQAHKLDVVSGIDGVAGIELRRDDNGHWLLSLLTEPGRPLMDPRARQDLLQRLEKRGHTMADIEEEEYRYWYKRQREE